MAFAALRRPMLMEVAVPFLLSSIVLLGMANCKTAPSAKDGQAAVPSPSWSNAAYARQRSDEAWHFAYAVQSWAAQHNAHLIMVPARSNIVVAKSFSAEEFSQVPISSFPDGRGSNPDQVTVLKHRWTGHGSSWDYDTDIKFVMYGPGFVKEGLRLDKTTLQNLAPTYAQLIGTDAPRGSAGRVMTEALAGKGNRPKVILTIVMDGGGLTLYRAWPNAWPVIKGLASRGVEYLDAKITQLETATGPSHAVIGTGGYPFTTRIVGNDVYDPAKKQMVSFFPEFSPDDLRAPTLADEYGLKTSHRAVVIGASFSAMPAMGMVGHGAGLFPGNKSHIAVFFGKPATAALKEHFPGVEGENRLMTNPDLFNFPAYLRARTPSAYLQELTGTAGTWKGHKIDTSTFSATPAGVRFECDNMSAMIEREPIDQPGLTSLLYLTFKGVDLSAHRWGVESIETRENLVAQDTCVGKLIEALNRRVGEGNYVVTLTADHGMAPLPELVNGHRMLLPRLLELIDKRFGAKISVGGGSANLWFDQAQMKERGISNQAIADYLGSLTAGEYYGSSDQWPAYLPKRPDERVFFKVYTLEQVADYVNAHPLDWMVNPYTATSDTVAH